MHNERDSIRWIMKVFETFSGISAYDHWSQRNRMRQRCFWNGISGSLRSLGSREIVIERYLGRADVSIAAEGEKSTLAALKPGFEDRVVAVGHRSLDIVIGLDRYHRSSKIMKII